MIAMKAGILLVVIVASTIASVGCTSGGATQAGGLADPATQIIKDSMGLCQMTIPEGWKHGKTSVTWAEGPEGSKAELLAGAGTGTWEQEKTMVRNLYFGQTIKIIQDDSSGLTFEVPQPAHKDIRWSQPDPLRITTAGCFSEAPLPTPAKSWRAISRGLAIPSRGCRK